MSTYTEPARLDNFNILDENGSLLPTIDPTHWYLGWRIRDQIETLKNTYMLEFSTGLAEIAEICFSGADVEIIPASMDPTAEATLTQMLTEALVDAHGLGGQETLTEEQAKTITEDLEYLVRSTRDVARLIGKTLVRDLVMDVTEGVRAAESKAWSQYSGGAPSGTQS